MRHLVPAIGAMLVIGAVVAFSLGAAQPRDDRADRAAARVALVGGGAATPVPPQGRTAGYWWSLAGFERSVAGGRASRGERLRRLTAVAAELSREAGRGAASSRSRSLTLLGLTRLVQAYLGSGAAGAGDNGTSAVSALHAAVVLDSANDDAKANLELLLQASSPRKGRRPSDEAQGTRPGQRSRPQSASQPASGAGKRVLDPPVGY